MKIIHIFSALTFALAVSSAPAKAEVLFTGSTAGCFNGACPTFTLTAADGALSFTGSTFSASTLDNVLFLGTAPATPNVNNFGSLTLSSSDGNQKFAGDVFELAVTFSQPTGTSPNPGTFTVDLQGSITGNGKDGSVGVNWLNPIDTFTSSAGTFTLDLNNVDISPGGSVPLTGTIMASAVPESSTWAMLVLGFLGVGFMAYRNKDTLRLA